ncbi:unnamed protein product [Linum tenue]|uniref:Uncharacterized protein n=1 Tax=Linum tenue TaxID=586396 RepID=A0AAV0QGJ5_9ROSI|nr:unnamed protein product [Linum tenue]
MFEAGEPQQESTSSHYRFVSVSRRVSFLYFNFLHSHW